MKMTPKEISRKKLLLVEGNDEINFFAALSGEVGLKDAFQIMQFGGAHQLKHFLPALAKMPEFRKVRSIGLIRDADENGEIAAFQSVRSSLQSAEISAPDHAGEVRAGTPSVGIYILPGNGEAGMLETLVYRTIADGPINDCINKFFSCVEESGIEQPLNLDKARVFSYLAVSKNPHHSVGVAAKQGIWDLNHDAFRYLKEFLLQL